MRGALVEHVHTYVLRNAAAADAPDMLQHQPQFSGEIVGVQKLCFFSFPCGPGFMVARKYADTNIPANPNLFFPLLKDDAKKHCLGCSALAVRKPCFGCVQSCVCR